MGDLTHHFNLAEFACRCLCGLANPHPYLAVGVELVRQDLGVPVYVSGPGRCPEHNARPTTKTNARGVAGAGGAAGSRHQPNATGHTEAADLVAPGRTLEQLYQAVLRVPWFKDGGVGVYMDDKGPRVHADVRRGAARWGRMFGRKVELADVLAQYGERTVET